MKGTGKYIQNKILFSYSTKIIKRSYTLRSLKSLKGDNKTFQ